MLFGGNNPSSRLPFRSSLVAVVEDQGHKARSDKPFSKGVKIHLFNGTKPMGHDNGRLPLTTPQVIGVIEPTSTLPSLTEKGYILSHRNTSCPFSVYRKNVLILVGTLCLTSVEHCIAVLGARIYSGGRS